MGERFIKFIYSKKWNKYKNIGKDMIIKSLYIMQSKKVQEQKNLKQP